ncbi:MAG: hypothetical protein LC115_03760 [Bacteroidia bacterium]|nr:hypothetical protein [Bacteroidia bacterium]
MHYKVWFKFCIIWFLWQYSFTVMAQEVSDNEDKPILPKPALKFGLGFLGITYNGDLNANEEYWHRFYPGGNLSLQFNSVRRLSPQLNIGFSKIIAQDRSLFQNGQKSNNYVETPFFWGNVLVKYRFYKTGRVRPHIAAGIGILGFNPKDIEGNNLASNQQTREPGETYSTTVLFFPLNAGVELKLNSFVAIALDYYRFNTTTDYLDNVGKLGKKRGKDILQGLQFTVFWMWDYQKMKFGRDRSL